MMRPLIFHDFEFRWDDAGQLELILGCFWNVTTGERWTIDCRDPAVAFPQLQRLVDQHPEAAWAAFAAHAEATCFLRAGVAVTQMAFIDLMAEARQVTASHPKFFVAPARTTLLTTLTVFDIPTRGTAAWKETMRDRILASNQYRTSEWAEVIDYCWSDIEPLPKLWAMLCAIHAKHHLSYDLVIPIARGDYIRACAIMEYRSRGFPVDVPLLHRIYGNRKLVMKALAEQMNQLYGDVFRWNRQRQAYSFWFAGLLANVRRQPVPVEWELTASGRPRTDEEYLLPFGERNEYYKPLVRTYLMLRHFAAVDLREQMEDGGFIKGLSLPFHTNTGRNQPKVSRGFILNMQPWLRSLVRPEPDHVLICVDYSQQEVAVAGALSGDPKLAAAVRTGDAYLALARMAGAIPLDGTKATHPIERETYKVAQLGLSYGMQALSLGKKLFLDLREPAMRRGLPVKPYEDCVMQAGDVLRWHRREFETFWSWNTTVVRDAKRDGALRCKDGWTTFANLNSSDTRLGNFLMQSTGAAILRQAIKELAKHPEIEFVCSLHDAIYIYCHEDDEIVHTNTLKQCMTRGARTVMRHARLPLDIEVETTVYTHAEGYTDKRDLTTMPSILKLLDEQGV